MDEKLRRLSNMGRKIRCTQCGNEWRPDALKDKRCPNCQKDLVKEIEMELGR